MTLTTPSFEAFLPERGPVREDIVLAAEQAYEVIAPVGVDKGTAHRIGVCYDASSIMVHSLVEWGHRARQEFVVVEDVGPHSYGIVMEGDEELIADPTWQQLLAKHLLIEYDQLPRVLVGDRREVMRMARSYGVSEAALKVWEAQGAVGISFEQQRLQDQAAEDAAQAAAEAGAWEKFMIG